MLYVEVYSTLGNVFLLFANPILNGGIKYHQENFPIGCLHTGSIQIEMLAEMTGKNS